MEIDLNADLGEGVGFHAELLALVTSANVSCGGHAGDPATICETLELAKKHGVTVGAHPGYPDREHFGRHDVEPDEYRVYLLGLYQIGALATLARSLDVDVRYVKPHGALYNQAATDDAVAAGVLNAAVWFDLPLVGLPGSRLEALAEDEGHPFVAEGFADRRYRPDGTLVPRTESDAFVHDPKDAVAQVEWLVREKGVRTVCVHGDNPDAVAFAAAVRATLKTSGFRLVAFT